MNNQIPNSDEIFIKGFFINPIIAEIEAKGNSKDKEELRKIVKVDKLNPLESYPVRFQVDAERILCNIRYGNYSPDAYFEFGKKSFERFVNGPLGQIAEVMVGKNPEYMIMHVKKLYDLIGSGSNIVSTKLGEKKYSVRFFNDPYALRGFEGVLACGIEFLQLKGKVTFIDHQNQDHEYILEWE